MQVSIDSDAPIEQDAPSTVDTPSDPHALWALAMDNLAASQSRAVVDAWYRPIQVMSADRQTMRLAVGDRQTHDLLVDKHLPLIQSTLARVAKRPMAVELSIIAVTDNAASANSQRAVAAGQQVELPIGQNGPPAADQGPLWSDRLLPMLSFETFVEGRCNRLAFGVARAVAEAPGTTYNPLFVHGGVGVGKTHLLHAIGLAARALQPNLRVLYVSAASFIDDVIAAMRAGKQATAMMAELRRRYRNVDVLLVDDIQFLRGKTRTEEEFFHTFNALHHAARQIVLTSDRHPAELEGFSDRLSSRFSWGLVAEMSPPDRETRIAILLRKSREYGVPVPLDVVHYLADHLRNNVRELESALKKLLAHQRIGGRTIDLAMTRDVMGPLVATTSARMTIDAVQRAVVSHFGLRITDLKGSRRHRAVVRPRMIGMYLCRELLGASYPEIGRAFGGRDHATAINAHRRIAELMRDDDVIRESASVIAASLGR